jgi:hypothetical protein
VGEGHLEDDMGRDRKTEESVSKPAEQTLSKPTEMTPIKVAEATVEEAQEILADGPAPLEVWQCPGCPMKWVGENGSAGHVAYKMHIKRHAHAREE